jgi:hypothetical protein
MYFLAGRYVQTFGVVGIVHGYLFDSMVGHVQPKLNYAQFFHTDFQYRGGHRIFHGSSFFVCQNAKSHNKKVPKSRERYSYMSR